MRVDYRGRWLGSSLPIAAPTAHAAENRTIVSLTAAAAWAPRPLDRGQLEDRLLEGFGAVSAGSQGLLTRLHRSPPCREGPRGIPLLSQGLDPRRRVPAMGIARRVPGSPSVETLGRTPHTVGDMHHRPAGRLHCAGSCADPPAGKCPHHRGNCGVSRTFSGRVATRLVGLWVRDSSHMGPIGPGLSTRLQSRPSTRNGGDP
jgi:hypothetical protein